MEKDVFQNDFGTEPTLRKRVKRDRNNDLFEILEKQDTLLQDDPFSHIYSFSSCDSFLDSPLMPLDETVIISSFQTDLLSEFPDDPHSFLKEDVSKKMDQMELSSERSSPNYHEETTMSMDFTEKEVQYCQDLLNIRERLNKMIDDLRIIEENQKMIIKLGDTRSIEETHSKLTTQLNDLGDIQTFLYENSSTQFLTPQDIDLTWMFENEILLIQAKINVLLNEIMYLKDPKYVEKMAFLVISSQPFPKSVKQNKPLKEDIIISLITGSSYTCKPLGEVKAEFSSNVNQLKSKNQSFIKNNTAAIVSNRAVFNNILFPSGSRKKAISLKFHLDVEIYHPFTNKTHQIHIESSETKPIIVKTNENQWEESEGILLKSEAFRNKKSSSSWFHFANSLQKRYLIATKQSLISPTRPLTIEDFDYIYRVKFNNTGNLNYSDINLHQFDTFWQWFGPGLHKIRYQRHLCKLWVKGYVCGYVPRSEAEVILKDSIPGTFLIRLSERINGTFTIAYTIVENNEKKVYHYIVNSDDVSGAKKTLPDFLGNETTLTKLVKVSISDEYKKKYEVVSKDDVLGEFYSKKTSEMETDGYDRKIIRSLRS